MLPFQEMVAALGRVSQHDVGLQSITLESIGELHFVEDGHHRVSVARAMGDSHIDAYVKEVRTALGASPDLKLSDLPLKRHEVAEAWFHEEYEPVVHPQGIGLGPQSPA